MFFLLWWVFYRRFIEEMSLSSSYLYLLLSDMDIFTQLERTDLLMWQETVVGVSQTLLRDIYSSQVHRLSCTESLSSCLQVTATTTAENTWMFFLYGWLWMFWIWKMHINSWCLGFSLLFFIIYYIYYICYGLTVSCDCSSFLTCFFFCRFKTCLHITFPFGVDRLIWFDSYEVSQQLRPLKRKSHQTWVCYTSV